MKSDNFKPYLFENWHIKSWKDFNLIQQPNYLNSSLLLETLSTLKCANKIVTENEINQLKYFFSEAEKGNIFILQAGDCAETFESCSFEDVKLRVDHILSLAKKLEEAIEKKVIVVGRIAGQYAKPRSEPFEILNHFSLPAFRGDIINGIEFNEIQRQPDPLRLLKAYENSKKTYDWIKEITNHTFFISHEALLLDYESNLTHKSIYSDKWLNFSAHTLWLGERTRDLKSAHVEYLRGISNPIGIKLGPNANYQEIISLLKLLNPQNISGKINLITRFGNKNNNLNLENMIHFLNHSGLSFSWSCDPMHGNSYKTNNGFKTRNFDDIISELIETHKIHNKLGSFLSGIHLELTYKNVTECIGGYKNKLNENNLSENFQSFCDPRLNKQQSSDLIELFSLKRNL